MRGPASSASTSHYSKLPVANTTLVVSPASCACSASWLIDGQLPYSDHRAIHPGENPPNPHLSSCDNRRRERTPRSRHPHKCPQTQRSTVIRATAWESSDRLPSSPMPPNTQEDRHLRSSALLRPQLTRRRRRAPSPPTTRWSGLQIRRRREPASKLRRSCRTALTCVAPQRRETHHVCSRVAPEDPSHAATTVVGGPHTARPAKPTKHFRLPGGRTHAR